MKIYKFYTQGENGFLSCVASVNANNMWQAIYFFEKQIKKVKFNDIVKIEML
jgi:hypothetical protein